MKFAEDTSLSMIAGEIFGDGLECEINGLCCFTTHYNWCHMEYSDDSILSWDVLWKELPATVTIIAFDAWTFVTINSWLQQHAVAATDDQEVKTVMICQSPTAFQLWLQMKDMNKEISSLKNELTSVKAMLTNQANACDEGDGNRKRQRE